jgi:large subunit ribosomal protein L20
MPRSVNKVAAHQRKKKYFKLAKGYWGARSKVWTVAKHHVEKGLQYAYRDRRNKRRDLRRLWITRINAAARMHGLSYSRFMNGMTKANIDLNRKYLADLAATQPEAFSALAQLVIKALAA